MGRGLGQRLVVVLAILLFAVGAFYGALVIATQVDEVFFPGNGIRLSQPLAKLPGIDTGEGGGLGASRINILVMGLDRRPREGKAPTRTDTMFVLTIDPQAKTAGILGIPRDLWVDIPGRDGGYFKERINTAYVIGETNNHKGGGPGLAMETVEHNLGVDIDHYVIIDFEGFKRVIDALGGVDVDVPSYLSDPYYSESELPGDYDPQEFEAGVQHMDGSQALAYSRIRRGSSDLDRIQRQQRVMFAVMDQALNLDVLPNALDLWSKYKDTIETDINDFQIAGFAKLAADIPQDRINALSLGPATIPWTTPDGAAVLRFSAEGIKPIVDALFSDQGLVDEKALVEVQNGTGEPGLASTVADYLVELGFASSDVVTGNAGIQDPGAATQIVDFTGKKYTAQKLADLLGVPVESVRSATPEDADLRTSAADILVIIGADAQLDNLSAASTGGG